MSRPESLPKPEQQEYQRNTQEVSPQEQSQLTRAENEARLILKQEEQKRAEEDIQKAEQLRKEVAKDLQAEQSSSRTEEQSIRDLENAEEDDDLHPPTLLQRLKKSKTLRALSFGLSLFGAARSFGTPMEAQQKFNENLQEQNETTLREQSLEISRVSLKKRELSKTVEFNGEEANREELKDAFDANVENILDTLGVLKSDGIQHYVLDVKNGHIDSQKVFDLYGDQLGKWVDMNQALEVNSFINGESIGEQKVIGDIIRDTLLEPTQGGEGFVGVHWNQEHSFTGRYSAQELQQLYTNIYEQERATLDSMLDAIDYDNLSSNERNEAYDLISTVGKEIVESAISQVRIGDLISIEANGAIEKANFQQLFEGITYDKSVLYDEVDPDTGQRKFEKITVQENALIDDWKTNLSELNTAMHEFDQFAQNIGREGIHADRVIDAYNAEINDWYQDILQQKVDNEGLFGNRDWKKVAQDAQNSPITVG